MPGHNLEDIDFVGVTDEPAVQKGCRVQIFRDTEPVVKKYSAADELTLGNIEGLEDAVTFKLPEGKLGVIFRIRVAKGPVLLILGKAAEVVKQGGHGSEAAVVFPKAKTCTNPSTGGADPEGVFLLHVQAALVQGVRFPEGQDMVSKPVLKKLELFIVHGELFCLGWKGLCLVMSALQIIFLFFCKKIICKALIPFTGVIILSGIGLTPENGCVYNKAA
jgi:hypothetical protein